MNIGVYGARGIPSTYSGYETFLTVLLPALVRRGHEVTIYCRPVLDDRSREFEGVQKVFLPAIETKQLSTLSHGAVSALVARARRHDVALVVNVANAAFTSFNRLTGQPVVLNTDGQEWLRGKWGPAGRRYFRTMARLSPLAATALVSDSAGMAEIYHREFKADSTVIPYCWTGLEPSPAEDVLPALGVEPLEYYALAGRLIPENNAPMAAEAYVASGSARPLLVLGGANYDSPVERQLRAMAAAHPGIRLVGHVADRAAFARILASARAYIHAHSVGGINPSLIEAMGCGANIVALDTVFNAEALGGTGTLFADRSDLAELLCRDASARHRDEARSRARVAFAVESVVEAYLALLTSAVRSGRRRQVVLATPWQGKGMA